MLWEFFIERRKRKFFLTPKNALHEAEMQACGQQKPGSSTFVSGYLSQGVSIGMALI